MRCRFVVSMGLLSAAACLAGCGPSGKGLYPMFQDEDPSVRLQAILRAGDGKDPKVLPYLIDRLTDSESEVRFFAAVALKRLTGKEMGYKSYGPSGRRAEAVRRWRDWLRRRKQTPTTRPKESGNP